MSTEIAQFTKLCHTWSVPTPVSVTDGEAEKTLAQLKKSQKLYEDALAVAGQKYLTQKYSEYEAERNTRKAESSPQTSQQLAAQHSFAGQNAETRRLQT